MIKQKINPRSCLSSWTKNSSSRQKNYCSSNEAPSDVNTTFDGSTYPGCKMFCFNTLNFFLANENGAGYIRTSAATYKVMKSQSVLCFALPLDYKDLEASL